MLKTMLVEKEDWKKLHHYKDEYNFRNVASVITFILHRCNIETIFIEGCNNYSKVISQDIKTKGDKK
jgi:hypothetical protein